MSMRRVGIFLVSRRRSCLSRRMEEAAHADGDRDHREQQRPTLWRKAFDRFLRDPLWIDELRRYEAGDCFVHPLVPEIRIGGRYLIDQIGIPSALKIDRKRTRQNTRH